MISLGRLQDFGLAIADFQSSWRLAVEPFSILSVSSWHRCCKLPLVLLTVMSLALTSSSSQYSVSVATFHSQTGRSTPDAAHRRLSSRARERAGPLKRSHEVMRKRHRTNLGKPDSRRRGRREPPSLSPWRRSMTSEASGPCQRRQFSITPAQASSTATTAARASRGTKTRGWAKRRREPAQVKPIGPIRNVRHLVPSQESPSAAPMQPNTPDVRRCSISQIAALTFPGGHFRSRRSHSLVYASYPVRAARSGSQTL